MTGATVVVATAVIAVGHVERPSPAPAPTGAADVAGSARTATDVVHLDPVAASASTVTCWDGHQALASQCRRPLGQVGLATVFPSLTAACRPAAVSGRAVEAYVCPGDGYLVRYTRWQPGFDRFAVFTRITGSAGTTWTVRGRFAGRSWTSDHHGASRWTATYRSDPYSVAVIAADAADRAAGVRTVRAVAPGRIGR